MRVERWGVSGERRGWRETEWRGLEVWLNCRALLWGLRLNSNTNLKKRNCHVLTTLGYGSQTSLH